MVYAKRSLSQNFLIDPNLRRKLVAHLEADPDDAVLEVGPGHGELSDLLAGRVARLVLVEKDDKLHAELAERLGERPDVDVIHADALECDLNAVLGPRPGRRVISNLPYGITTPLIFRLLDLRPFPRRMVLLVQREVADRVAAAPGGRSYGALSVGVQARAHAEVVFRVGRRAFRPVPRVDSAALVLEPRADAPSRRELEDLRVLTRVAFSRRRKQIGKILRSAPEFARSHDRVEAVLADLDIAPRMRPEALGPDLFLRLAARLSDR